MKKFKINEKTIKKIISTTASAILTLTICFCLFVLIQVLSKGYASFGKYSFFKVVTASMEPNLAVGEVIINKAIPMDDVKVDDIVSFRSQSPDMFGMIITHRVVEIDKDENGAKRLLTKGDANLSVDGRYVLEDNFIGKVTWSSGKSFIAKLIKFVSSGYGFIACIAFPLMLILSFVLNSGIKRIRSDMNELVEVVEQQNNSTVPILDIENDKREYEEMCRRIKEELMEELTNSEDTQFAKTE
jgi:signal peptidase I